MDETGLGKAVHMDATLRAEIASGLYPVGSPLPSVAALCDRFSCARMTVRKVLGVLATEGIIATRQGSQAVVVRLPDERPPVTLASLDQRLAAIEDRLAEIVARFDSLGETEG